MSNSRQIASLPNILTLIDDAGGQFIKQQAAGVTTSYTITWPSAVGSSGAVLALTDGSGGLGWQSTLGIALSGGTVNNSVIGGSTPAAITGTTITANTAFVGPLTGNSTTATALAAGRTFAFTGDATGTSASFDGSANVSTSLTLAASGVSANSYGSATAIPVITVDSKGRITAATTAAISSSLTIGADNGSNDTVTIGTDTLNFVGTGSEIETTVSNNQIQIGLPSTVSGLTTVSATNLQGALAGTIASTTTGATQAASDNSTKIATTAYVTTALANLIDSAPAALNTLNELAAALGDDANFSTTVTNSIATKLALAGGTMTGNLILGDNVKALFGTGSDLEIYHDGSNSYIVDAGTGGILYRGGTQTFQNAAGSKTMAVLNGATSVDLYYDNSKKFETTAAGVTITGTGTATTFSATTLTGTLSTAAQPNVTSVGTLSALTVSGNLNATLTTAAQTNITSVGTLTGLTVNGTANATTFVGALTGNVTGNVSGTAATVTGAAQTNITSLGALSALTVSGDVTIDTSTLKVDTSNNRVGILNASPDVTLDIGSATDSIHIPVGTTAQRPGSPAAGYFRYNSSLSQFEGYTSAWGAIGGGGTNTFNHNVFTGDGSTTAFALAAATESENNLLVFIDGVFQEQGAYSIATSGGTTTLTMSAAPASGRKLVVYQVSAGVSGSNLNIDTMTGDGSDTTLTLSIAPVNENNTQVFFDGVYQNKSTYSISGSTLTFSTAPPTGVAVEVMTFTQTEVNVPVNDTIDTVHIKDNAVTVGKLAASLNLSSNTVTLPAVTIPSASTATTQAASDNTTKLATTAYVTTAIAALIDGAPGTLNTLNELAAALADDASFSSSVTTSLAAKANLAAPNFTGSVTFDSTTLVVDSVNDRVGIGTSSPDGTLHVKDAVAQVYIQSNDGQPSQIVFGDVSDASRGRINYDSSDNMIFENTNLQERMRIAANGNVGIGTASPTHPLEVTIDSSGAQDLLVLSNDNTATSNSASLLFAPSNGIVGARIEALAIEDFSTTANRTADLLFYTRKDGTLSEKMRIDNNGNVGIGTSPSKKLHVYNTASADVALLESTQAFSTLAFKSSTNSSTVTVGIDGAGNAAFENKLSSGSMTFVTNLSERMRIDSNGKLLVNTNTHTLTDTEMVVSSEYNAAGTTTGGITLSARQGGGWRSSGIFANGTDLTFTTGDTGLNGAQSSSEKMRIDSSGNVLVGRTNPSFGNTGHTLAPSGFVYHERDGGDSVMYLNRLTSDGDIIRFYKDSSTQVGSIGSYVGTHLRIGSGTANVLFVNNTGILPSTSSGAASDGLIDLGDSGRRFKDLYLSGKAQADTYQFAQNSSASGATEAIYRPTTGSIAFKSNSSERMRIDSSGNVLVGKTSQVSAGRFGVQYDSGQHGIGIDQDFSGAGTLINFLVQNGAVGSVQTNGTATTYNTTSDQRLKENIVDAPSASDDIDAIQVRSFDWKVDGSHQKYGMVAQELQNVAPEAVSAPEDPEEMMGVDYSKLVPMLVKEIQALRTRVQELENN